MALKAQCKWVKGHEGDKHLDENGNWFVGSGQESAVVTIRTRRKSGAC
jgi:hypothetical protein